MTTPDYYRILGVAPYSEDVVIQAAYRALMRRYHPDTNKSAGAGKRATEINEAYAVLSDPALRANYDAERKARREQGSAKSTSQSQQSSPPPPPPPTPPGREPGAAASPAAPPSSTSRRGLWVATGLIGAYLVIAALVASSENRTSTAENNMAVENLTAENLVVENDLTPAPTPPPKPTLATVSQSAVQFDNIESAAARFAQVLTKTGMSGARATSEKCHSDVTANPTWSSADWCAAFDFAAAHIDAEVGKANGWPPTPYFQFQAENQADRYTEAGASELFVTSRLTSIKTAAESAVDQAMAREIAKEQARRQTSPGAGTSEGPTGNSLPTPGDEPSSSPGSPSRSSDNYSL